MSTKKKVSAFAIYKERKAGKVDAVEEDPSADSPVSLHVAKPPVNKLRTRKRKRAELKEVLKGKKLKSDPKVESNQVVEPQKILHKDGAVDDQGPVEMRNVPFADLFKPEAYKDSRVAATKLFKLMISPLSNDSFFSDVWEQQPVVLHRQLPRYNDGWFSSKELDCILRENYLEYSTNIDITTYVDGVRKTHNPVGRASAARVWQFFKEGCSIRLLNPQTFSRTIWKLNSTLQELFTSGVGANTYLTPAGSQGFSPHYDDIEAFVMQLEGRKKWKIYKPRNNFEHLPRFSSENFREGEIGEPLLEVILEPGDLLYFPRGFIHQASTFPDTHSLHVTVSTYQKNTWSDFLEKLLPAALEVATHEDPEFRSGLPLDYLHYTGIVHSDSNDHRRDAFFKKLSHLCGKLLDCAPIDAAADQMGVRYCRDALPPCATEGEDSGSVGGTGARWEGGRVLDGIRLSAETKVRLFRSDSIRLVMESESVMVYTGLQNTRCPHEKEPLAIEIHEQEAPGVEYLIQSYPNFVTISEIPIERSTRNKIRLCNTLYQQGLLKIKF